MTIRRKLGRVTVSGSSSDRLARISRSSSDRLTSERAAPPDVIRAAVAFGVTLAAVYASTPETRATALRARRNARHRLARLVGPDAVAHFAGVLEHDGGLFLRALHAAPVDIREHALSAAVTGAQTALEHAVVGRAAQAMLVRSSVWAALCAAYQHASLKAGGDEALDKRAAACGQQSRLDLLGALDLAKVPILAPKKSEPAQDGKRMLAEFYADLDAKEGEHGTPSGGGTGIPQGE